VKLTFVEAISDIYLCDCIFSSWLSTQSNSSNVSNENWILDSSFGNGNDVGRPNMTVSGWVPIGLIPIGFDEVLLVLSLGKFDSTMKFWRTFFKLAKIWANGVTICSSWCLFDMKDKRKRHENTGCEQTYAYKNTQRFRVWVFNFLSIWALSLSILQMSCEFPKR
jgi:hypothetical protein